MQTPYNCCVMELNVICDRVMTDQTVLLFIWHCAFLIYLPVVWYMLMLIFSIHSFILFLMRRHFSFHCFQRAHECTLGHTNFQPATTMARKSCGISICISEATRVTQTWTPVPIVTKPLPIIHAQNIYIRYFDVNLNIIENRYVWFNLWDDWPFAMAVRKNTAWIAFLVGSVIDRDHGS